MENDLQWDITEDKHKWVQLLHALDESHRINLPALAII